MRILEEVYFPSEDTFLLLDSIDLNKNERMIIEIGGGSGIISIVLAKRYPKSHFVISDLSIQALKSIRKNKQINNVNHQIEVVCTDKTEALAVFTPDVIIWNPPYLPKDKDEEDLTKTDKLMLIGGKKGFEEVYELISQLEEQKCSTKLVTIFSSLAWNPEDLKLFNSKQIKAEIISETKFFFEKLYLVKFQFDYNNG